jgi:predicted nuclease of predicted toxin-antitoxin system
LRGAPDEVIWRHAAEDQRVFVTGDLDFPLSAPNPPGMLLLRGVERLSTSAMSDLLLDAIRSLGTDVAGLLIVVSPGRLRRRRL